MPDLTSNHLKDCRSFFAALVTANAGVSEERLLAAFKSTPREKFVGAGPWKVFTPLGYIETPSDDPAFLYQDTTVQLDEQDSVNNGQPTLHAFCLGALNIREGETIVHVGAGTGYYTALLSKLTGQSGTVEAFEIKPFLAAQASANLGDAPNATVHACSGSDTPLPMCDVIYVNAGATGPRNRWLDALRTGGRLLFPLTPAQGHGAMLLIKRISQDQWEARFLCRAMFIPCIGARDDELAKALTEIFRRGDFNSVRSLRRYTSPDQTCCIEGPDWWLSTAEGTSQSQVK
jgi:protein-L-isoaspartate(D-aspartate) O-methyltransferase